MERSRSDVEYFLLVCDLIADAREGSLDLRAGDGTALDAHEQILEKLELYAPTPDLADQTALYLASDSPGALASGLETLKSWPFAKVSAAADELLSAHPSGFSTTRGDLLDDLLP